MTQCPVCEKPLKDCLGHTPGEAARIFHATRAALRARVAELEAKHPDWMQRIRRERREAVALAVDSINVQLREHGIDMQFDASAFIQQ